MDKETVIYCYSNSSSFIEKDIRILSKKYSVIRETKEWNSKVKIPLHFLKQFYFYFKHLRKSKAVVIMFAGYWSLIPVFVARLYKKPSFIILGGTDCVSYPEFNYGSLRKSALKKVISFSVKKCTSLLPVAIELIDHKNTYYKALHINQGIKAFIMNIDTKVFEIPNGYEVPQQLSSKERITNSFISVAFINDETRFILKGFDRILLLAKAFPEAHFSLVGLSVEIINKYFSKLKNVTCYNRLNADEINTLLEKHEFYLQLSISEGHPNALCEGMLSGCIPIGSNVTSIPRIIGKSGFIIYKQNDNDEIVKKINEVIKLKKSKKIELSSLAYNQIKDNFVISKRATLLLRYI